MARGKNTCKILKEIRKQIAEDNDIELVTSECTYQGDCEGTCPKCESEVRYLERELEKRQRRGQAAVFAGMSIGTLFAATGCSHVVQPLAGAPMNPSDSTEIVDDIKPLAGDVLAVKPVEPVEPVDVVDPRDTIFPPLMGIVPMFNNMFTFDSEGYENLMKDKFVFPGMKNLTIVDGEILYQKVASDEAVVKNLEELVALTKQFSAPHYPEGEAKMLEFLASELGDVLKKGKFAGDMEVKFFVIESGDIRDVEIVKGIDKTLDDAVAAVFSQMKWEPAFFELEDGSLSSSFPCHCIQKIHFPIKK